MKNSVWDRATKQKKALWLSQDRKQAEELAERNKQHILRGEPVDRR